MKRMLLVTLDFPPLRGGVARLYADLLSALPSQNVAVLTPPMSEDQRFDATVPYPVIRERILGSLWPAWKWTWLRILSTRRQFRFDTLGVGQLLPLGYPALTIKTLFGTPYVVFVHGLDILSARRSAWKKFWMKVILRGASLVVANSGWTRERAIEVGARADETVVVHPCPGAREFSPEAVRRFVERWNLGGKRVILSVGRLVRRKGHDMMIEALPDILRANPDAVWVVAGDGPERERLMHSVSERALADRVVFTGAIDDEELSAAYGAAGMFVLPTREEPGDAEGFGIVFLEAGAVGLPVVAGRGGGVEDAVVDGETGFLVDPRNPAAVAAAVNRLLDDRDLARRMGEAGRQRVLEEFQWRHQAGEFMKALSQAVGGSR